LNCEYSVIKQATQRRIVLFTQTRRTPLCQNLLVQERLKKLSPSRTYVNYNNNNNNNNNTNQDGEGSGNDTT